MTGDTYRILTLLVYLWVAFIAIAIIALVAGYGFSLALFEWPLVLSGVVWFYRCLGESKWPWEL